VIRTENPLALLGAFVLFLAGAVVYPAIKSGRVHVTSGKVVAIVLALGACVYNGTFALLLVFLWPLSFIWFPEYWGNYTGFLRVPYIDSKTPSALVSLMGWFFLAAVPPLFWWIARR